MLYKIIRFTTKYVCSKFKVPIDYIKIRNYDIATEHECFGNKTAYMDKWSGEKNQNKNLIWQTQ